MQRSLTTVAQPWAYPASPRFAFTRCTRRKQHGRFPCPRAGATDGTRCDPTGPAPPSARRVNHQPPDGRGLASVLPGHSVDVTLSGTDAVPTADTGLPAPPCPVSPQLPALRLGVHGPARREGRPTLAAGRRSVPGAPPARPAPSTTPPSSSSSPATALAASLPPTWCRPNPRTTCGRS